VKRTWKIAARIADGECISQALSDKDTTGAGHIQGTYTTNE